jgi:hypothetical protein
MAVIKLVEDYAVTSLRNDVRDAMMMTGEQAILLQLYHPGDADADPCPQCGGDIYNSPEEDCLSCYGTMFNGGVRVAMLVWTVFTDHDVPEQLSQRGVYRPDSRSVQFEAFPMVSEHDVIVRVQQWASAGVPSVLEGYYILQSVTRRSLRTGNRFGQFSWDVVGQKAQCSELNSTQKGLTLYPILGQTFMESVATTPATSALPSQTVYEPDVKVVYTPIEAIPGESETTDSGGADVAFVYNQSLPASTWTITHTLGYEPTVSIIVAGEEVDADVDFPNNSVVVITFNNPQTGIARLT